MSELGKESISIRLVRYDLKEIESEDGISEVEELKEKPLNRDDLLAKHSLPKDSIIKLKFGDKWIPWSLVPHCSKVEIQVFRPHQNSKIIYLHLTYNLLKCLI